MRIACPDCNAAYDVPQEKLAPGRGVKCARCGTTWAPIATEDAVPEIAPLPEPTPAEPPAPASVIDPPAADFDATPPMTAPIAIPAIEPPAEPTSASSAPIRRRGPPVLVGWLLTLFVLCVFAWLAYARRSDVMHAWPPSARIYSALRLDR